MYARSRIVAVALAAASIAALSAATWPATDAHQRHWSYYQTRLDTILGELRARDVSGLSQSQRANRARNIETLRRYRDIGEFPRNYDFAEATPYFVDRKTGTLCAVAYLLDARGRRDIVDRVAMTNNNVWVDELSGDAQFRSWLDEQGLTLAEAARIQVPYAEPQPEPIVASVRQAPAFTPASVAFAAASLGAAVWDRKLPSRASRITSYTAGAGTVGLGLIGLTSEQPRDKAMGFATVLAGSTAILLAGQRFMTDRRLARSKASDPAVNLAPTVSTEGAGLAMTFRF
jgi:hypothetical protein